MSNNDVTSMSSTPQFIWGDGNRGWHYKSDGDFCVTRETIKPGTSEVKHYHVHSEQFFYVVSGELVVVIEGVKSTLTSDQGIVVRPGHKHSVHNKSDLVTHFLIISSSQISGDRVEV